MWHSIDRAAGDGSRQASPVHCLRLIQGHHHAHVAGSCIVCLVLQWGSCRGRRPMSGRLWLPGSFMVACCTNEQFVSAATGVCSPNLFVQALIA